MARRSTATRTITNAGRLRVLEIVAATKAIGLAPTESSVEADGIVDLEYDKTIRQFEVQPVTVGLLVDGQHRKYTPDIRYVRPTGVVGFREFKDAAKPLSLDEVRKLEAANERFTREGYEFGVVDSAQLRRGYRMANLRLLRRYARWPVSEQLRHQVVDFLQTPGEHTLGELRELVGYGSFGSLYRMLWDQEVGVDLVAARLCAATPVWSADA